MQQDSFVCFQQYMAAICLKERQSHVQFIPTVMTFSSLGSMPELTRIEKSTRGKEMNHQILQSFSRKKKKKRMMRETKYVEKVYVGFSYELGVSES